MAIISDACLALRMGRIRLHGIASDAESMRSRPNNEIWNNRQIELSFNCRMTDIYTEFGLSQMLSLNY